MVVRYKKLRPEAKTPVRSTSGAGGLDLTAVHHQPDEGGIRYYFGLAFEIPPGHVGLIFSRSSINKTGLLLSNGVGVIDSDYRGEVTAVFRHDPVYGGVYHTGDRVAQMVIVEAPSVDLQEVDDLTPTERGSGGYGSTGR